MNSFLLDTYMDVYGIFTFTLCYKIKQIELKTFIYGNKKKKNNNIYFTNIF